MDPRATQPPRTEHPVRRVTKKIHEFPVVLAQIFFVTRLPVSLGLQETRNFTSVDPKTVSNIPNHVTAERFKEMSGERSVGGTATSYAANEQLDYLKSLGNTPENALT